VLVVPGVGHSVLTSDISGCAVQNVQAWLDGQTLHKCNRVPPAFPMLAGFPRSVASMTPVKGVSGIRGRTLATVKRTLAEAEAAWLAANGSAVAGLYGGRVNVSGITFKLRSYSDAPGLAVSGTLRLATLSGPYVTVFGQFVGTVTVSGAHAAHGSLYVQGASLSGTLAQKRVSG
jgi:hypothetical protein